MHKLSQVPILLGPLQCFIVLYGGAKVGALLPASGLMLWMGSSAVHAAGTPEISVGTGKVVVVVVVALWAWRGRAGEIWVVGLEEGPVFIPFSPRPPVPFFSLDVSQQNDWSMSKMSHRQLGRQLLTRG